MQIKAAVRKVKATHQEKHNKQSTKTVQNMHGYHSLHQQNMAMKTVKLP
jgi:hypothetical protein